MPLSCRQKGFQFVDPVVQDQVFGKPLSVDKSGGKGKVSDMLRAMTVAGENDRDTEPLAGTQDPPAVFPGISPAAARHKGRFIDFHDDMVLSGMGNYRIDVQRVADIVTVSRDFYAGMTESGNHGLRILFYGRRPEILHVEAGNAVIQKLQKAVVKIQLSFLAQNITFGSIQNVDAATLFWRIGETTEIGFGTGSRSGRSMIRDTEKLQPPG